VSYTCFDVSLQEKIAHVSLKRPEAFNSMVPEFWQELPEIVNTLDETGEARAIVLSSTGKHFTAGMDLAVFTSGNDDTKNAEPARRRANLRRDVLRLQETFSCLDRARIPVLAAIQGGCIGGGVDMISACDMRYCTEDAFFCIQEINIGMTADVGTFPRLPHLIPQGIVRELAYTGRRLSAQEAVEVGLVNRVYPNHDALVEGVLEIAGEIAARSPLAVCLDYIATWQTGMFQPTDMMEAFTAKSEKREPEYADLLPLKKKL
jgi:enoyl-CoA hydratase